MQLSTGRMSQTSWVIQGFVMVVHEANFENKQIKLLNGLLPHMHTLQRTGNHCQTAVLHLILSLVYLTEMCKI